jgi:hypothetical protein
MMGQLRSAEGWEEGVSVEMDTSCLGYAPLVASQQHHEHHDPGHHPGTDDRTRVRHRRGRLGREGRLENEVEDRQAGRGQRRRDEGDDAQHGRDRGGGLHSDTGDRRPEPGARSREQVRQHADAAHGKAVRVERLAHAFISPDI